MPNTTLGFPYPASSDDVQLWPKFQALAVAIDTFLNLPAEPTPATLLGNSAITATSFGDIGVAVALTNPSSVYNLLVDISLSSLMLTAATGTLLQLGVRASGGLTFTAASGGGGAVTAAEILRTLSPSFEQKHVTYPVTIPAGAAAVTFNAQAMRANASAATTLNDVILRVRPRRFLVP